MVGLWLTDAKRSKCPFILDKVQLTVPPLGNKLMGIDICFLNLRLDLVFLREEMIRGFSHIDRLNSMVHIFWCFLDKGAIYRQSFWRSYSRAEGLYCWKQSHGFIYSARQVWQRGQGSWILPINPVNLFVYLLSVYGIASEEIENKR